MTFHVRRFAIAKFNKNFIEQEYQTLPNTLQIQVSVSMFLGRVDVYGLTTAAARSPLGSRPRPAPAPGCLLFPEAEKADFAVVEEGDPVSRLARIGALES